MPSKKRLLIFCIIVVFVISLGVVIAKHLSSESSLMVKEGIIKDTRVWDLTNYPGRPDETMMKFEDGETIVFIGQIEGIQVGRKYRIVYHEKHEYFRGQWSGKYNVIDSIEEIK